MVTNKAQVFVLMALIVGMEHEYCSASVNHRLGVGARTIHSNRAARGSGVQNNLNSSLRNNHNDNSSNNTTVDHRVSAASGQGEPSYAGMSSRQGVQDEDASTFLASLSSSLSSSSPSSSLPSPSSSSSLGSRMYRIRMLAASRMPYGQTMQNRERDRAMQVANTRARLLRHLRFEEPLRTTSTTRLSDEQEARAAQLQLLREQFRPTARDLVSPHTRRLCFSGQCSAPSGMNTNLWQDAPNNLRLNFPLPRLDRRRGREEQVVEAKLHLFFKPMEGCPCLSDSGEEIPHYEISIHQFIRRLVVRKGRVVNRTNILTMTRVPLSGNVRLTLNVKRAVEMWMQRPRRNMGLEIRVKHPNGTEVNARDVFATPRCSRGETERECREASRFPVQSLSWPANWLEEQAREDQERPYLAVRVADVNQPATTAEERAFTRRLGTDPRIFANIQELASSLQ